MMPETAASESQAVQAYEKWERDIRELREATKEEPLNDAMQRTALLQKIITVQGSTLATSVKKREFKAYEEMRDYVIKYAMNLRAEENDKKKDDPMLVDQVGQGGGEDAVEQ